MKSRLVILALVGLSAGVVGTVGSRIVGGSGTPTAAAVQPAAGEAVAVAQKKSTDKQCRALVKKVSKTPMSDAQLKKLLKKNKECRAVVIDSKAPAATASSSAPNIVTLPATSPAVSSDDSYEDDDAYEDDDSYEDDDDDEGEHEDEDEGENNNNNDNNDNFENEEEDD
jgi:hypothetical protein